ncbi:MAG: outer membrane lipoprotein-sorting protein [Spirochaetales bacterium]|nr:outer membrane lipoprotein-sorting protein [Spirochaetales bacterium]
MNERTRLRVAAIAAFVTAASALAQGAPEALERAEALVGRFYSQQRLAGPGGGLLEDMMLAQELTVSEAGKERRSRVLLFSKNPDTCLVYVADERGQATAYLRRGDDTWIYRDTLRLPLKVSRAQAVLGEANLGDLLGIDLWGDFEIVGASDGAEGLLMDFSRSGTGSPYASVRVIADAATGDLARIEYKGTGGQTIREAALGPYATLEGGHRVPAWTIRNLRIGTSAVTTIRYTRIAYVAIPDAFFKPEAVALGQFLIWAKGRL